MNEKWEMKIFKIKDKNFENKKFYRLKDLFIPKNSFLRKEFSLNSDENYYLGAVIKETEKAVKVTNLLYGDERDKYAGIWIPKSVIEYINMNKKIFLKEVYDGIWGYKIEEKGGVEMENEKKYILLKDDYIKIFDEDEEKHTKLYRIKAVKDFSNVKR